MRKRKSSASNKVNPSNSWWKRQSGAVQGGLIFGGICLIGLILILGLFGIMISDVNPDKKTQATKPEAPSETTSTVNTTSNTSEEDIYRQWVKEDYIRWENAMGNPSQLYQLYQGAKAKKPPEKYRQFHQHYINSYYYYYKAALAAKQNNIDDVGYYTDLAFIEDEKMAEYMPDYAYLTYHD